MPMSRPVSGTLSAASIYVNRSGSDGAEAARAFGRASLAFAIAITPFLKLKHGLAGLQMGFTKRSLRKNGVRIGKGYFAGQKIIWRGSIQGFYGRPDINCQP